MKCLYFCPVGKSGIDLVRVVLTKMKSAEIDTMIGIYDDLEISSSILYDSKVFCAPGARKWEMAKFFLSPEVVKDYDYIFLWDDDIEIGDFDPNRFINIMHLNRLDCGQPSILSPFQLSHAITRQKPCGEILAGGRKTVGRFTNFVEIMVPVFSRNGWVDIYDYIDDINIEGKGYDYIPLGRRGIVDCMHVVHTRPVRFKSQESDSVRNEFLKSNGFRIYQGIDMGFLLE